MISAKTTQEALDKYKNVKTLFNKASMNLRDFISNDSTTNDGFLKSDKHMING